MMTMVIDNGLRSQTESILCIFPCFLLSEISPICLLRISGSQ